MEQKYPCIYPVFTKIPTPLHFATAYTMSHRPHINGVEVILPGDTMIPDNKDTQLFYMYGKNYPTTDVSVRKSDSHNILEDLQENLKKHKRSPFYLAVDETTARSKKFNRFLHEYPGVMIELVPSTYHKLGAKMLKAIEESDSKGFKAFLPEELTEEDKQMCWELVKKQDPEIGNISERLSNMGYWRYVASQIIN